MSKAFSRRSFIKGGALIGASTVAGVKGVAGLKTAASSPAGQQPVIAVAEGKDAAEITRQALNTLKGMGEFVPKGSRVAILANAQRNNPGAFTKPDILKAAIEMCLAAGAKEVNCITQLPEQNWKSTGLAAAVEAGGGKLILVERKDESQFKPVQIKGGKALKEARIMKVLYENDVFINMPITKDHAGNKFTGTLKNMMGINSSVNNRTFHKKNWTSDINAIRHLDQCIADLNTIVTPDLSIVDATEFITTNGPFGPGKLFRANKVVAGTDRVAIDAYCCTLWGLSPKDIIMINEAHAHGLGEMDLKKVAVKST